MHINDLVCEAANTGKKLPPPSSHKTPLLPELPGKITAAYQRKLKALSEEIHINCSGFLQEIFSTIFLPWRGSRDSLGAFLGVSRDNRQPKDSLRELQLVFDQALAQLGFTAVRGNSVFVTSDYDLASSYGTPYVIIPWDTCDFTWSQSKEYQYRDLILESRSDIPGFSISQVAKNAIRAEIKKIKSGALSSISPEQKIVMIETLNGILRDDISDYQWELRRSQFSLEFQEQFSELSDFWQVDLQKFQKKFQPSRENFSRALRGEGEILIRGTYYGLSQAVFNEMREQNLL